MGKRAQLKRSRKEGEVVKIHHDLRWFLNWIKNEIRHPHFIVALLAFVLVSSYPVITHSKWYRQHVAKVSEDQLTVETATTAVITTEKGVIEIELERKAAPKTTENFILLTKRGYYNNLTFHRVEEGFVIQGGDPKGNGTGGESAWGGSFADEIDENAPLYQKGYVEGTVAMANSGPNTNGSQFFITLADQPTLPKSYTIFGHVTNGMDVVKKIAKGDKMINVEVK